MKLAYEAMYSVVSWKEAEPIETVTIWALPIFEYIS